VHREVFDRWINALGDRWFPLSEPSKAAYWAHLSGLSDAEFEATAIAMYALDQNKFPSPAQFLEAKRQLSAPEYQPPALPSGEVEYSPPPQWWHEYGILFRHFTSLGWRFCSHQTGSQPVYVLETGDRSVFFRRTEAKQDRG